MVGLVPFNRRNRGLSAGSGFRDFYNVLDDFFATDWPARRSLAFDTFKVDIQDKGNEYLIEAEMPGIKKDEIALALNDGQLTITVSKDEEAEEKEKNYIHRERRCVSMSRNINLADTAANDIKAKLTDGVLKITVPKEEKTSKEIAIEVE